MTTGTQTRKEHTLKEVSADEAKKAMEKVSPPLKKHVDPKAGQPRPDLGGKRLRLPGEPAIYLIDPEGLKHWIPDPYTYNRIFRDWNGIFDDPDLNEIQDGGQLTHGASVIRADGAAAVYFVSNGTKRWVVNPANMDKCNFNWPANGDVVGPAVVDAIPTGLPWSVPIP